MPGVAINSEVAIQIVASATSATKKNKPSPALIDIVLTKIKDHAGGPMNAFSILFNGPKAQEVPQESYQLRHTRLGELELLLVPVPRPGLACDLVCY